MLDFNKPVDKPIYKVSKPSKDHTAAVITKRYEKERDLTLAEMMQDRRDIEKQLKEFEGKYGIELATKKNIEEHNPFIGGLNEEQIHACYMWHTANANVTQLKPLIKEYKKALKEIDSEIDVICDTLGFTKSPLDGKKD